MLTELVANNDIWSYRPLLEINIPDLVKRKGPVRNKLYKGKDLTLRELLKEYEAANINWPER